MAEREATYLCCRRCNEEKPKGETAMRDWERLSVMIDSATSRLTVWCNRHNAPVASVGFHPFSWAVSFDPPQETSSGGAYDG